MFLKVLCVHPNYELYGSDRCFASYVAAIVDRLPSSDVEVVLPAQGPLTGIYPFNKRPPRIQQMWILRRRNLLRGFTIDLPKILAAIVRAWREMRRADIVYLSTIILFDFIFASRFVRKPVVLHIHEIPNGIEAWFFRRLVLFSKATMIFNSEATRAAFHLPSWVRSEVVYNGFSGPGDDTAPRWDGEGVMRTLMIGRINHWKGQEILVSAVSLLTPQERARMTVRFLGGTFNNQDDFRERLEQKIKDLSLADTIRIDPFEDDPSQSYHDADVVVVPSRLPEPFGCVAVEAMAFSRPVIASGHGGLVEIVQDGETGLLFPPGDAVALANALRMFLADPSLAKRLGANGRMRYLAHFTEKASQQSFLAALQRLVS